MLRFTLHRTWKNATLAVAALACGAGLAIAAPPASDTLLPATTKASVSIPDMQTLRQQYNKTQIGELTNDPTMQPFMDSFGKQVRDKLAESGRRLKVTWDDVEAVAGGEAAFAVIQPNGDRAQHASAVVIDTTGKAAQVQELLQKVDRENRADGGQQATGRMSGLATVVYSFARTAERPVRHVYYITGQDLLIACDHPDEAKSLALRATGNAAGATLAQLEAYRGAMQRCREEFQGIEQPHVRWFFEPFGYLETRRAMQGGRRRQGTDYLRVLSNQGFRSAIRGAGGWALVKPEQAGYELLHRSYIYAPPVLGRGGQPNPDKYELAARMLNFPNGGNLQAPPWAPRDVAAHATFNWQLQKAFEFSSTLVNEIAGEPIFEDVLDSLQTDPKGPRVDLRSGLVAHLGTRVTILSDYHEPITPTSERMLAAFELTNPDAVSATLAKAMANDPTARKVMHGQQVIWEIIPEGGEDEDDGPVVEVGPRFGGRPRTQPKRREQPAFPNSALAVAHGHLMSASHIDFMKEVLDRAAEEGPLASAGDYQRVMSELEALGAGEDSFRYFARTDQANYVNYELLRQGKMPQSKSLLGRALNELFVSDGEGATRSQEIDARTLPNYDVVRRHLGPAGMYVRSEENGWLVVGCALSKDLPAAEAAAAAGR